MLLFPFYNFLRKPSVSTILSSQELKDRVPGINSVFGRKRGAVVVQRVDHDPRERLEGKNENDQNEKGSSKEADHSDSLMRFFALVSV